MDAFNPKFGDNVRALGSIVGDESTRPALEVVAEAIDDLVKASEAVCQTLEQLRSVTPLGDARHRQIDLVLSTCRRAQGGES